MELLSCTVFKFLNQHYKRWFRINFYVIIYQNVYIVHFFVQFYTELTLGVYVFCFFFDKNWSCQTLLYWKIGSAEQHELGFLTQRPKLINTTQNEKKMKEEKHLNSYTVLIDFSPWTYMSFALWSLILRFFDLACIWPLNFFFL
jgi:hypothetical protein